MVDIRIGEDHFTLGERVEKLSQLWIGKDELSQGEIMYIIKIFVSIHLVVDLQPAQRRSIGNQIMLSQGFDFFRGHCHDLSHVSVHAISDGIP